MQAVPSSVRSMFLSFAVGILVCSFPAPSDAATDPRIVDLTVARQAGVAYDVSYRSFTGPSDPRDARMLDLVFAPMTREQFDTLTTAYGGTGFVPYVECQRYDLTAFLPPKMQALVGHRLEAIVEPDVEWVRNLLYDVSGVTSIHTCSNCYCTVWELLRNERPGDPSDGETFHLFWNSEHVMSGELTSDERSRTLGVDELRFGDVVLFFERVTETYRRLLHAAMFIDQGVYFEKTDTLAQYAWRLVSFTDMERKLRSRCEQGPEALDIEFRRYRGPVPDPIETFSVLATPASPFADAIPRPEQGFIIIADEPGFGGRPIPGAYRIAKIAILVDPSTGMGVLDHRSTLRPFFVPLSYTRTVTTE